MERELSAVEIEGVEEYIREGLEVAARLASPEGQAAMACCATAVEHFGQTLAVQLGPVLVALAAYVSPPAATEE